MTPQPTHETLTNAELLEAAYDLLIDLLDHSVELEGLCPLCADSARTLYEQIETRIEEINTPDDKTSLPPGEFVTRIFPTARCSIVLPWLYIAKKFVT